MLKHYGISTSIILRLPKNKPIRKLNLYLGFPPAKRANPIRLVMNLRVPFEAHTEARTACLTSASSCGEPKAITLVRS